MKKVALRPSRKSAAKPRVVGTGRRLKKTIINPEAGKGWDMFRGSGVNQLIHSEGVCVDLPGVSLVYLAGKTATDEHGQIVGRGDIKEQTRQVIRNLVRNLASVGGTIDDIVHVRVFVTQFSKEQFCTVRPARSWSSAGSPGTAPSSRSTRTR